MLSFRYISGSVVFVALALAAGMVRAESDNRQLVQLPAPMQEHMLGNMRDHLRTLDEINRDLAEGRWNDAATVAEQRLGVSSLAAHGAEHMAPYMPKTMQAIGTAMHRAATEFAVHATEGDLRQSVKQLAEITRQCVACHVAYRIR